MTQLNNGPHSSRRSLLATAATGSMTAFSLACTAHTASAQSKSRTFLLVHGAWRGAWIWRRVEQRLAAAAHRVFVPTLTGLAERSHLMDVRPTLATHIADVVNMIRWEELKDITLCGHSYGGFVIAGVAEQLPKAISGIVFLDAFIPADGDTIMGLSTPRVADAIKVLVAAGNTSMPPVPAAAFAVNEADRAYIDRQCTPQALSTFTEPVRITGAYDRIARKTYIRAVGYATPSFDAALAKAKSDPTWQTHTLPCGHDAMLDLPDRVAELLVQSA